MKHTPFGELFPEVAAEETRSIIARGHKILPDGVYGYIDCYCADPSCDCRRAMVIVVREERPDKTLATISYGWEPLSFYQKWWPSGKEDQINNFKGPALASMSRQSELSPVFLDFFLHFLDDKEYVKRLKKHYKMFKKAIKKNDT